ncbi:uncharacterized protein [Spinacia oleracea]|uniref:Maturase MatK N-terminal domain-containing protein n=1 Tax=Spinacia oleracea TaxID=3562 RepID=A0ABM3QVK5_SPIOL|nr:uncharacterized protein LOC130462668 [Spinacia oleracea]XP_056687390.1 uncharacterized protein LOC130462668 [Spinacia oleracea]
MYSRRKPQLTPHLLRSLLESFSHHYMFLVHHLYDSSGMPKISSRNLTDDPYLSLFRKVNRYSSLEYYLSQARYSYIFFLPSTQSMIIDDSSGNGICRSRSTSYLEAKLA